MIIFKVILCLLLLPACLQAWQADRGDGTYQNPILFADYSDPDAIRVGSDFYLVSSSFSFMPGIPILKSHDLVNWTITGHVFPRLDINPAYDLTQTNRYGRGCWAPAIRHHNGRFYVFFPTPDEGIFMTSAAAAEGPWDPIVCVVAGGRLEDPCPFWDDDGSAYLIHSVLGAGPLMLHKLSPDGKQVLDEGKIIVRDSKNLHTLEGPKLYKRHGFYYIFAPFGGVGGGSQAVLRSTNIYGPYDYKVVLGRGATPINGPHQGGYVETPSGQGWFLHFQSRGAWGRIIHLQPVVWVDDWPVMGEPDAAHPPGWTPKDPDTNAIIGRGIPGPVGQPVMSHVKPDVGPGPIEAPQTSDEFTGPSLGLQWEWNHNPVDDHWSLTERPGFLRLKALPASDLLHARNTLTQMLADPVVDITTLLDTKGMTDHQRAGLCLFSKDPSWIGVEKLEGRRHLVFYADKTDTIGPELTQNTIQLRASIAADQTATYAYSLDGVTFIPLGTPAEIAFSWWKGARPGLFSFNTDPAASGFGVADFDWWHYQSGPAGK
jgi:beta-xylosidase